MLKIKERLKLLTFISILFSCSTYALNPNDQAILLFGGSFSPPTLEHMSILTNVMTRFSFRKARMLVALPYKAGAAPAETSLALTKVAVEHVSEVLDINQIEYQNFQKIDSGRASWNGAFGVQHEISVDDSDIKNQIKEDTLASLKGLHEKYGDETPLYWISGGDSFASVPSWTPEWRELFEHASWVIISRSDLKDPAKNISFFSENPLQGHYPEEFLSEFRYEFDAEKRMHIYRSHNNKFKDIIVVDLPTLGDSSTKNRASLASHDDHQHAQQGLQPSVFSECLIHSYYSKGTSHNEASNYSVFTQRNLEIYLRWLFTQLHSAKRVAISESEYQELEDLSHTLLDILKKQAELESHKGFLMRNVGAAFKAALSYLNEIRNIPRWTEKIQELARKYDVKNFVYFFAFLEILELSLGPVILHQAMGPFGILALPFFHPAEVITGTSFVIWNMIKQRRLQKQAAGDVTSYKKLINFRNRLMRGDPEAILIRLKLKTLMGLGGGEVEYNVIQSRLPKWLPLTIRNWDNNRVRWHDLNVSTNELEALLKNPSLVQLLKASAAADNALYAHWLNFAVRSQDHSRMWLDIFLSRRYFSRFFGSQLPPEITSSLSREEQILYGKLQAAVNPLRAKMEAAEFQTLQGLLSDYYSLTPLFQAMNNKIQEIDFWYEFSQLMITEYPNKKVSIQTNNNRKILRRLLILEKILAQDFGQEQTKILRDWIKQNSLDSTWLKPEEELSYSLIENSAIALITELREIFSVNRVSQELRDLKLLTQMQSVDSDKSNLVYEIKVYQAQSEDTLQSLKDGLDRAKSYLEQRRQAKNVKRAFMQSWSWQLDQLKALEKKLRLLEFEVLKFKYPLQNRVKFSESSAEISKMRQSFANLKMQTDLRMQGLHEIIYLMNGVKASDLENIELLRASLAQITQMPSERSKNLGRLFCSWSLIP